MYGCLYILVKPDVIPGKIIYRLQYRAKFWKAWNIIYRYIMFGRGICEKYQSRDEQFPEPKCEWNLVSRLVFLYYFTNSGLALWICRMFTSCRCIYIRFNCFSWYLQNRICRFYPSPRRVMQIYHVRERYFRKIPVGRRNISRTEWYLFNYTEYYLEHYLNK
jgi:hypothetical protein